MFVQFKIIFMNHIIIVIKNHVYSPPMTIWTLTLTSCKIHTFIIHSYSFKHVHT